MRLTLTALALLSQLPKLERTVPLPGTTRSPVTHHHVDERTLGRVRGLLAKARSTGSLAVSGALRILTAAAAGTFALTHPELNGALLGVAAWILSYAIETAVSTWQLRRLGWFVEA